ncbi:MAG: response regulator [Planctomycetes bacterium]|jgi:CheY-like chemotaxis protein|nr:response regulator [Planctomycetota bacterium]
MPARILLVDDDPGIRFALGLKLKSVGYLVAEATDGREAVDYFATGSADLVIMDVGMPRMDGYTAAATLRAGERTRAVPILFLTAQNFELPSEVAAVIGKHGFLTKPFSPRDVTASVASMLAES